MTVENSEEHKTGAERYCCDGRNSINCEVFVVSIHSNSHSLLFLFYRVELS